MSEELNRWRRTRAAPSALGESTLPASSAATSAAVYTIPTGAFITIDYSKILKYWWLRSPYTNSIYAWKVLPSGIVFRDDYNGNVTNSYGCKIAGHGQRQRLQCVVREVSWRPPRLQSCQRRFLRGIRRPRFFPATHALSTQMVTSTTTSTISTIPTENYLNTSKRIDSLRGLLII